MEGIGHLLTLLGLSWVAATFFIKLRDKIDEMRNLIVYQIDPNLHLDMETRLYMLDKDIRERMFVLTSVLFLYSASMIIFALISYYDPKYNLHFALFVLFMMAGSLGAVSGLGTIFMGMQDYKRWKKHIKTSPKN